MAKNIYRNKTVAQLIKIAVRHFHLYIRNRDQGKPCISCSKKTKLQAGHFYSAGKHPQLRFNEDNVHGQCLSCNYYMSANLLNYRINLIDKIGMDRVYDLEQTVELSKKQSYKWDRFELVDIIEKYKALNK
jgi:hypothetical protein